MVAEYFAKWFFAKSRGIDPLDRQEAERRHRNNESYVALIRVDGKPAYLIDVAGSWLSVSFFDADERPYLNYDFTNHDSDKLFLKGALHREFAPASNTVALSYLFNFRPDGSYIAIYRAGESEREVEGKGDPLTLWNERPQFGNYADLCVVDRIPKNVV